MSRGMKWTLVIAALVVALAMTAVPRASEELSGSEDGGKFEIMNGGGDAEVGHLEIMDNMGWWRIIEPDGVIYFGYG